MNKKKILLITEGQIIGDPRIERMYRYLLNKKIILHTASSVPELKKNHFLLSPNNNYSLSSYGLDQILLSYQLTSRVHKDKFIIFGFLMEDLDRVIFDKRNYPKIKFKYQDGIFVKSNTPIVEKQKKLNIDLYIYRFIKNFIFL